MSVPLEKQGLQSAPLVDTPAKSCSNFVCISFKEMPLKQCVVRKRRGEGLVEVDLRVVPPPEVVPVIYGSAN